MRICHAARDRAAWQRGREPAERVRGVERRRQRLVEAASLVEHLAGERIDRGVQTPGVLERTKVVRRTDNDRRIVRRVTLGDDDDRGPILTLVAWLVEPRVGLHDGAETDRHRLHRDAPFRESRASRRLREHEADDTEEHADADDGPADDVEERERDEYDGPEDPERHQTAADVLAPPENRNVLLQFRGNGARSHRKSLILYEIEHVRPCHGSRERCNELRA